MTTHPTWVIGSGGLLGSAVVRALWSRGDRLFVERFAWDEPEDAIATARAAAARIGALPEWRVIWCAGSGVTGSSAASFALERAVLDATLDSLGQGRPGTVFFASSAGALYAGSAGPPFSEGHTPQPLAPYGHAKLDAERHLADFARDTGHRVLIGRIANLYGPGQKLDKPQGLISHLLRSLYTRAPMSIYVPLDTIRDYLYVDDCAAMILDALDRVEAGGESPVTKIQASHRPTTVGELIGEVRRLSHRRPPVVLAESPLAALQSRDLRLRSTTLPDIDHRSLTPLGAGIAATAQNIHTGLTRAQRT